MLNSPAENPVAVEVRSSRTGDVKWWTNVGLLIAIALGLGVAFAHGGHQTTAIAWAGASLACGGLIGFLFGIPGKTHTAVPVPAPVPLPAPAPVPAPVTDPAAAPATVTETVEETSGSSNLEQVSDWVTKLLLGGGLTQMQNIPGLVWNMAYAIATGMALNPNPTAAEIQSEQSFACGLLIYFAITGFFAGFLITKLQLGRKIQ